MSVKVIDNNPKKGDPKKPDFKQFMWNFVFWFALFYTIFFFTNQFFGEKEVAPEAQNTVRISLVDKSLVYGQLAQFQFENNTNQTWTFNSPCDNPDQASLKIYGLASGVSVQKDIGTLNCSERKNLPSFSIAPSTTGNYTLGGFNPQILADTGQYQFEFRLTNNQDENQTFKTETVSLREPGFFRSLFRNTVTKPLFNLLVFFIDVFPGHSLGLAVIALTVLVRLILFLPNQKAMKSQRKLQKLQPKMEEIKKKFKDNQQMMAMQTMALYKKEKINPMSSCLPMLLQIPFMLGIYLVVKDGLSPHLSYLLYKFQTAVDLTLVQTQFLGLDLAVPDFFILPPLVGIAQYIAIKLSMANTKKNPTPKKDTKKKEGEMPSMMEQMQQMQKFMLYGLPVMITVFTATLPAAVGVYWLTSTLFGIGQQQIVNKQLDKPQVKRKD